LWVNICAPIKSLTVYQICVFQNLRLFHPYIYILFNYFKNIWEEIFDILWAVLILYIKRIIEEIILFLNSKKFKFKIKHCKVKLAEEHCTITSFSPLHLHFYPIKHIFRFLFSYSKFKIWEVIVFFQSHKTNHEVLFFNYKVEDGNAMSRFTFLFYSFMHVFDIVWWQYCYYCADINNTIKYTKTTI